MAKQFGHFGRSRIVVIADRGIEPPPRLLRQHLTRVLIEPIAGGEPLDQCGAHESGEPADGALGEIVAQHQRQVPILDARGVVDDLLQCLLTDFRAGVGEQLRDRGHVERFRDRLGDAGTERPPLGNGGERIMGLGGGDDLHQVRIG